MPAMSDERHTATPRCDAQPVGLPNRSVVGTCDRNAGHPGRHISNGYSWIPAPSTEPRDVLAKTIDQWGDRQSYRAADRLIMDLWNAGYDITFRPTYPEPLDGSEET